MDVTAGIQIYILGLYSSHSWEGVEDKAKVIDEEALCGEGSLTQTTNGENAGTTRKQRNGAEQNDLTVVSKGLDLIWDGVWSHGSSQRRNTTHWNICPCIILHSVYKMGLYCPHFWTEETEAQGSPALLPEIFNGRQQQPRAVMFQGTRPRRHGCSYQWGVTASMEKDRHTKGDDKQSVRTWTGSARHTL